jgi:hypothetical protein
LNYIIYVSQAVKLMKEEELAELLKISRRNNEAKNITGVLLYGDGSFIQVLEGSVNEIEFAFESIKADKRHNNITHMISGELPERNFPDWKMGFISLNKEKFKKLEGYINPANPDFLKDEPLQTPISILKTFAKMHNKSFNI